MGIKKHIIFLFAAILEANSVIAAQDRTFDYVVIGGGTAGLVVAARLSEDPHTTVAVIEAGIHHINEPLVDTPEFWGQALGDPSLDWGFVSVPQKALNNSVVSQARGKMLGGSSGLNFMAWDRASAEEYDAWEKLGATGWNWYSLLPYFKKSETVSPQLSEDLFPGGQQEADFNTIHGRFGPVQPSYNVFYANITGPFVNTVNALGIPTNSNPYAGNATGIYNSIMSIDRATEDIGKRSYAASTYYKRSADRPNFTAFVATQATKINFDVHSPPEQQRAVSVDVVAIDDCGITGTISARKEIVLSAGALQTPQMLELSGIGNKTIIETAGVSPLIDLPGVGENLQDHTLLRQDFEIVNTTFTYDRLRNNATFLSEQQLEYATNGTGLFASAQFALVFPTLQSFLPPDVVATLREQAATLAQAPGLSALKRAQYELQLPWVTSENVPYVEYLMFPGGGKTPVAPAPGSAYLTLNTGIMHPFSRGFVHINTSDPLTPPVIDPKYLSTDFDMQLALESAKFVQKVSESGPLKSLVVGPHVPPANLTSDAAWLDFIKTFIGSIFHPSGTAAMVPREIGGVVDPKTLKVYGTTNLRIVDASLFPLLIGNHPQATIYAIAERAADIIRGHL